MSRSNQGEITRMSILDEPGKVDKKLEPDLSEEKLLGMYRSMLLARETDKKMLKLHL